MSEHKKMVSIWTWVGMVLTTYGLIITASGVYYLLNPEALKAEKLLDPGTAALNPNLWWGAIMVAAGIVFLLLGKKARHDAD